MKSKWSTKALKDVAPAKAADFPAPDEVVWNLSLEEIESGTGRILKEVSTRVSELGSSKTSFDERHVLYSKLRPYLNKVVVPDRKGVGTSELIPLLPNPEVLHRDFLAFYLRSPEFLSFAARQTQGANLPRMAMREFLAARKFLIPSSDKRGRLAPCVLSCRDICRAPASAK